MLKSSPFLRGAMEAMAVNGLGLFSALVAQSVLAQALGPAGFGYYSANVAVAAVLSVLAVGGMDTALLRELPKDPSHTIDLVRRAERWLFIGIVAAAPVLVLWFGSIPDGIAVALLALFLAASTVRQFALRANFMVFWGRFPDIVMRPTLVAALVVLFGMWVPVRPLMALSLHGLSTAIVYLFGSSLLQRRVGLRTKSPSSSPPRISLRDRSFWLGLSLLTLLMVELDKLIGAALLPSADFGHYALASRLYGFGVVAMESLAIVAAPIAARAISQQKIEAVQRLERDVALVVGGVVIGMLVLIACWGEEMVAFLAPGFEDSVPVLKILALAAIVGPLILPRLSITSVVNPPLAWKLQSISLLGLALTSVAGALWWRTLGVQQPAIGLAWGIVAGSVFRAVLWRFWGRYI